MVNRYRGEVVLVLNGQTHVMRLTLGALAELEEALGSDSLLAMVQRFETGQFRARDVLALLVAGLRGGGWRGAPDELAQGEIQGGGRGGSAGGGGALGWRFCAPGWWGLGRGLAGFDAVGFGGAALVARCVLGADPGRTDVDERPYPWGGAHGAGAFGADFGGISRCATGGNE